MSLYLHWSDDEAKVRSFSASSKAKTSIVKIEIEVSDPYALGHILTSLQEAQHGRRHTAAPSPGRATAKSGTLEIGQQAPLLALPAPDRRGS